MKLEEALASIVDDGINLSAGDFVDVEALKVAADVLRKAIEGNPVIPGHDDQYNIAEMAYNNGYAKGLEDGKKDSGKRERWIIRNRGNNSWAECPVCLTCGSPHWKVCPVCETRMEPMLLDDSFPGSKTINIKKPDVEVKSYGE